MRKKNSFFLLLGAVLTASMLLAVPSEAAESQNRKGLRIVTVEEDSDNRLQGAEYTLAVKSGEDYEEIEGKTEISVGTEGWDLGILPIGEYALIQELAPNGYVGSEPVLFEVTEEGIALTEETVDAVLTEEADAYLFTVTNFRSFIVRLPSTGGSGLLPYTGCGLLLMAGAGFCILLPHGRKRNRTAAFLVMLLMSAAMAMPVSAAGETYQYYVMMKSYSGSAGADYYVETKELADGLLDLHINGKPFCTVTEELGAGRWLIELNDEADFTEREAADALAELKDQALASGTTQSHEIELDYGALVLVQSKEGRNFLAVSETSEVSESLEPDKNDNGKLEVNLIESGKYHAAIGETVSYRIQLNVPDTVSNGAVSIKIRQTMPEGLTLQTSSAIFSGQKKETGTWTYVLGENPYYEISLSVSDYQGKTVYIPCTATMNGKASALQAQKISVQTFFQRSGDRLTEMTTAKELPFYTFGFLLTRTDEDGNPCAGALFTLTNEQGAYYAEDTDLSKGRFLSANEAVLTTAGNGKILFSGLPAGTYLLTEKQAASGCEPLANPITVIVTEDGSVMADGKNVSEETGSISAGLSVEKTYYHGNLNVTNESNTAIPATGGEGTEFFCLTGTILMLAAGSMLLLRRRRMAL